MSENTKREIIKVDPIVPYGDNDVVTWIGNGRGADEKYGIVFPVPNTDDEAKDRYNCSLGDLVRMGVQKITTQVNYGPMFNEDGTVDHEKGQALADAYRVGVRTTGGGMTAAQAKKKAVAAEQVAIEMANRCGLSPEEVKAMIAEATKE